MPSKIQRGAFVASIVAVAVIGTLPAVAVAAWEPTKPVEFVVPAGTGGGADQMARFLQGVIAKNNLMKQPLIVVNKSGGAGAEGFLDVKGATGDPHKLIITLSNLFTTPLATGVPFNWKDLTPVAMLALDEFVLWVNAETPYKSAGEYMTAIKGGAASQFKMAGTGSKQEDQIITVALEKKVGKKMTYVPYKGGGDVAVQLVGKHVDSTVNNPIEAVAHWRSGALRPLCVFDNKPMPYPAKVTATQSWQDIPTCKSQGLDVEYLMLRGIFMPAGVTQEQVDYYVNVFKKVRELPEWKKFTEEAAFNDTFMIGKQYADWVANAENEHKALMQDAGFIAK
ncbi:MAG TPA: tripartite tricarboxylate transporter substrate-binding protein [Casimicrobiaceae bacterium]|nr:tripartite tricarboxylate transporter substrate-binding protein [Casimicrobiaceae bacterium]